MTRYEFHPLSKSLPLMWEPDLSELAADIKKNGQLLSIGLLDGKILDGRNRYRACEKLGITPRVVNLSPKDAKAFVTSMNVFRRHLTREQRQEYLIRLIADQESLGMTNTEVAQAADVSVPTVKRAKRKKGVKPPGSDPDLTEESKKSASVIVDDDGVPVPKTALTYWNRKPEARNVLNQISAARGQVKKLMPDDPMWSAVNLNGVIADLSSAFNRFSAAVPAHVCPYCKGVKPDNCKCCKGKGVVSKFTWSTLPEEIRKKLNQPF